MNKKISSRSARNLSHFTLLELLIVISVIMILITVLMPALSIAKAKSKTIVCASNIKQLSLIVYNYSEDYSGFLPATAAASPVPVDSGAVIYWCGILGRLGYTRTQYDGLRKSYAGSAYAGSSRIFRCPAVNEINQWTDIGSNANLSNAQYTKLTNPSMTVFLADGSRSFTSPSIDCLNTYTVANSGCDAGFEYRIAWPRHPNFNANISYADLHVNAKRLSTTTSLKW